jgi:predicted RNase H-like nuclease (RuvC/YqgF family)
MAMAEEPVDLRFLGEQIKRVQGDVRVLKGDVAQLRAENSKLEGEVAGIKADITRVEMRLDAFAESVADRFEQANELAKSNFRILDQKIDRVAAELNQKIDRIAGELNQKADGISVQLEQVLQRLDSMNR